MILSWKRFLMQLSLVPIGIAGWYSLAGVQQYGAAGVAIIGGLFALLNFLS